jgi:hypothetical protein
MFWPAGTGVAIVGQDECGYRRQLSEQKRNHYNPPVVKFHRNSETESK